MKIRGTVMQEFFKWTAWEMTPPESYGLFHILFMILGGFVVVSLAWLLRKTNERQNKIVLGIVGGFFLFSFVLFQCICVFFAYLPKVKK